MSKGDLSSSPLGINVSDPTEYYRSLPHAIKRRVRALKKLQLETVKIDAAFYREMFDLEQKYDLQHQKVFEKRQVIVSGDKEPNDDECDWPSDDEHAEAAGDDVEKLCDEVSKNAVVADKVSDVNGENTKGIPDFWLQIMRNVCIINDMIEPHDMPILKHLTDVQTKLHTDEPGFSLEFHFSSNPYFTNTVLTKRYFFTYDISPGEPFEYEGPEITSTKGCVINWNPGQNVTVKLIKKVQKKKGSSTKRSITKNVPEDSFFNFFDPPTETLSDDLDDDTQALLESDFKLGQLLRESIVPRAVLFFTGEEVDDDSDIDDEDDDDEDEDEDSEPEDDSEDDGHAHRHQRGRHHRGGGGGHGKRTEPTAGGAEQPECKQQ